MYLFFSIFQKWPRKLNNKGFLQSLVHMFHISHSPFSCVCATVQLLRPQTSFLTRNTGIDPQQTLAEEPIPETVLGSTRYPALHYQLSIMKNRNPIPLLSWISDSPDNTDQASMFAHRSLLHEKERTRYLWKCQQEKTSRRKLPFLNRLLVNQDS